MYVLRANVSFASEVSCEVAIRTKGRSEIPFANDPEREIPFANDPENREIAVPQDHFAWHKRVLDEVAVRLVAEVVQSAAQSAERQVIPCRGIVVLLESPHRDEYAILPNGAFQPLGPLVGSRRRFENHINCVVSQLKLCPSGCQSVVLCNPVPYQCSLQRLMQPNARLQPSVRNATWRCLFRAGFADEFVERLREYDPIAIINACTAPLRGEVTNALLARWKDSRTMLWACNRHPCVWDGREVATRHGA